MGYQGVWVIKEAIQWLQAVWDIGNTMGYEGVWVILGMCYKGVYCSSTVARDTSMTHASQPASLQVRSQVVFPPGASRNQGGSEKIIYSP